jgi:hypothetical protein
MRIEMEITRALAYFGPEAGAGIPIPIAKK